MTIAAIAATTLGTLATVHLYWAAGGRAGLDAAIPTRNGVPVLRPGRGITLLVALALAGLAVLVLWRDGALSLPLPFVIAHIATPLVALVFLARAIGDFRILGWSKRLRGSRFARLDDIFYAPLCLILALCFALVAAA